jgi:hypothetical protein
VDKFGLISNAMITEEVEDSAYLITTEDGVEIYQKNLRLGRLIGKYTGDRKDIQIPSSMEGWALKEIYQDVFNGKGLTSVVFDAGNGLLRIHSRAFQNNELSSVTLPEGLQSIDVRAFNDNNLTEITLPKSIKIIEQNAFTGNNITKITIGENVELGPAVFSNNNASFEGAYASGGAGTYVYDANKNWVKQTP